MVKRDLEIKDTGTLFGPHGGLIDRLDAVLFTVVAGYYLAVSVRLLTAAAWLATCASAGGGGRNSRAPPGFSEELHTTQEEEWNE